MPTLPVALNNAGQSAGGVSVSTLTITGFVVGAGANRCIFLAVSQWNPTDVAPTAVFNGTEAFTVHDATIVITDTPAFQRVTILKLVNPSVTTANIVVSWAGGVAETVIGATCWNNVDQSTPFSAAIKNSGGNVATTSSVVIPNAAGDVVHDGVTWYGGPSAQGVPNQTQRWRTVAAANTTEGGGQSATGAGSDITCTWSGEVVGWFCHIGVAIRQAPDLTRCNPRMALQQRMA